ncbi:SDR family NAD(P)-dependent oxidoreductase [Microbulbifer celer]|uniref:SDR family NAD(P)-dependent oxidoreductase n=1 Tax=Microbulbifer celer TaxID=435905 RepID=A0ABW3UEJ5_9GAMM|nr:SDR family oxidoreductase [Microbulbifer celer]UFN55769.1 SDR family oxidoreductase [Microbulbifer celer]
MTAKFQRDPLLDFTDKVVLITGAASGFGALLAEELGRRGASLVLGDINETPLDTLVEKLGGNGVSVAAIRCDVTSETDCGAMVALAREQFGCLDVAVNNAGIAPPMFYFEEVDEQTFDQQINVNVKGVFFGMKHQLKLMREQGTGTILNVSSMAGLGGAPKVAPYSAAKHSVIGLTRTAAVEYARHNVRVNAICPFYTLTPMLTDMPGSPEQIEQTHAIFAAGTPMKRLAEPEEIVSAMVMLCSPALSYVTGQAMAVDGGVSAF